MATTQQRSSATGRRSGSRTKPKEQKTLKTVVFDSVGNRKYAVQVRKARNDNPFLKLVEGVPQDDGTYRKFSLTIWSEDFDSFFTAMDELRAYIKTNNIHTPADHKYDPDKPRRKNNNSSGRRR